MFELVNEKLVNEKLVNACKRHDRFKHRRESKTQGKGQEKLQFER